MAARPQQGARTKPAGGDESNPVLVLFQNRLPQLWNVGLKNPEYMPRRARSSGEAGAMTSHGRSHRLGLRQGCCGRSSNVQGRSGRSSAVANEPAVSCRQRRGDGEMEAKACIFGADPPPSGRLGFGVEGFWKHGDKEPCLPDLRAQPTSRCRTGQRPHPSTAARPAKSQRRAACC